MSKSISSSDKEAFKQAFTGVTSESKFVRQMYAIAKAYGYKLDKFSVKQLRFLAHPEALKNRYKSFTIPKKSGGTRIIHAPHERLKYVLKLFDLLLRTVFDTHEAANGFVNDRSIVDNARMHVQSNFILNVDLKDFFDSFDRNQIKMFFYKHLTQGNEKLAFILASLVTNPFVVDGGERFTLPQGSPVSPYLTNLLCKKLDKDLTSFAARKNVKYSRYADDITFSSQQNVFDQSFMEDFKSIIKNHRLQLNPKKTRLQSKAYRQEVTGIITNQKLNVRRAYVKDLRLYIHWIEKYSIDQAQNMFLDHYAKTGRTLKKNARIQNVVDGKLHFMSMVKGTQDPTYNKLRVRFRAAIKDGKKHHGQEIEVLSDEEAEMVINNHFQEVEMEKTLDLLIEGKWEEAKERISPKT